MKRKLIQWPEAKYWDKPWNPIIGCRPCSPACEHCYAKRVVERFNTTGICAPGFAPTETGRVNPPRKGVVFCGNMTDLFGDWVAERFHRPEDYIVRTLGNEGTATYLWLTKRAKNMADVLSMFAVGVTMTALDEECEPHYITIHGTDLPNHYFGFTAENQEWYNERRATTFMGFPEWANLWLSAEPLLGAIDLKQLYPTKSIPFKWVVVGCESGPNRRPCKMEWVESIVEQCVAGSVPVFVKQLDIGGKCETDIDQFPKHLRIRQVPWKKEDEE